ncbi:MAG: adenylate/guanylate cyclase domain-containing protein [Gaiellaceae bacterium]
MSDSLPHGTVTFLFTDIEGSTELVRELGAEYARIRSEHRRVLRDVFKRHGGHEIDTAGDGFFVVFERAGDAVTAAVDAQRALLDVRVRVRMGLHSAEPHLDEEGYTGVGVHRAERICSSGHGGQILLSNATAGIVEDLGLPGLTLVDVGEHRLKGMAGTQRLFQLVAEGLATEFPALRSPDAEPAVITLLTIDLDDFRGLLRKLGDRAAAAVVRAYHRVATEETERERGRVVEAVSDSVIGVFDRPGDAVRAAVALRGRLRSEAWAGLDEPPGPQIAIHSGWVPERGDHSGLVAFHCIALNSQAEPWQILVSHATEALLEAEQLDVVLRDLGERELADLKHPVHVFELVE